MKKIFVLFVLLVLLHPISEAKSPGKTGATFLKIGVGAKPTAMGEAFCAVADDPAIIHFNPAGLASIKNKEFSFNHISWFEKINYEYLAYINPLEESGIKIPGVLAGSLAYLGINDIKEYGVTKDSYLGEFKAQNLLVDISYAKTISKSVSSGINLKYISQKIKSSSSGLTTDLGFLYKTPIKNLTSGLTFQNVGLFHNFKDELPFNIKLGTCYRLNLLTLAMDIDLPNDSAPRFHLGAEYLYPEIENMDLAIRVGYKTGVECGKLGFGFGVNYDKYRFDYAYSSYDDLGDVHRLSVNIKFDKTPKPGQIKPKPIIPEIKIKSDSSDSFDSSDLSDLSDLSDSSENKEEVVKEEPKEVVKEEPKEVVKEEPKEVVKEEPEENNYFSTKAKVNLWR